MKAIPSPSTWQSTSASNDFEAKLSLVPLVFGTLKASFYAMVFAVPLGVAGAIYTAYFMSAGLRKYVKPTVEIMAALPTVILGFLAGLWLAPIIEGRCQGGAAADLVANGDAADRLDLELPAGARQILAAGRVARHLADPGAAADWLGRLRGEPAHRERLHAR